jgi:acyl-CoA thioester hydrolase
MLQPYEPGSEADWLRSFSWSKAFRPRFFETDALGHVSNVFYTAYVEFGRLDFLASLDDPDRASASALPFAHNAAEITMRFVRPCFYDEPLRIHSKIAQLGRSSALMEHAITSDGGTDVRTIARVAIVSVKHDRSAAWSDGQRAVLEPILSPSSA